MKRFRDERDRGAGEGNLLFLPLLPPSSVLAESTAAGLEVRVAPLRPARG